jgi:uncharacterized membrane protein
MMKRPTDHDLDLSVAAMLRFGVALAALVVLVGGLLSLRHPLSFTPDYSHFHAGDKALRSISAVVRGTLQLDSRSIIQMGLILLIATPVARVVLCVIGFSRQKSALYIVISSVVLAILVFSLTKNTL